MPAAIINLQTGGISSAGPNTGQDEVLTNILIASSTKKSRSCVNPQRGG